MTKYRGTTSLIVLPRHTHW